MAIVLFAGSAYAEVSKEVLDSVSSSTVLGKLCKTRHCEERSDEAIFKNLDSNYGDCFASANAFAPLTGCAALAMTQNFQFCRDFLSKGVRFRISAGGIPDNNIRSLSRI